MTALALDLAGARIDLGFADAPPAAIADRYAAFTTADGQPGWVVDLLPGPVPAGRRLTGRVTAREGVVALEGFERHGFLDLETRRGRALLEPRLVFADALVRTAMALDLNARGGCLLHAAALVVGGVAHLVPGRSGSGKSTLAALAGDVLGDEICALVPDSAGFRVLGTPWWKGRPGSAPLAAVWCLDWDAERVEPLRRAGALRHLCANLVVPGLREAEETAFNLCGRVAAGVPFGRLSFRRDTDVDGLLQRGGLAA